MNITTVVLAGGSNSAEMVRLTGVTNSSMVELLPGKAMLEFVVGALKGASRVGRIIVVGDVKSIDGVEVIAPGKSMLDNLLKGVDHAQPGPKDRVLISTSDIPFIDSAAVDDFLEQSMQTDDDFCYPIISMDDYCGQFDGMKRTTLKLRDGRFTGGNVVLLSAELARNQRAIIEQAYAYRKDVFGLGRMIGWGFLARIIVSQLMAPNILCVADLEQGIGRMLGANTKVKAIRSPYPSLGADVDKPDDVAYAKKWLQSPPSH